MKLKFNSNHIETYFAFSNDNAKMLIKYKFKYLGIISILFTTKNNPTF